MVAFTAMRIAIMGTRGIPPMYGGYETMAWELSVRLVDLGHEVTVYCRSGRTDEARLIPSGVHRRFLPAINSKYLETVSHTGISAAHALLHRYDAVLLCNAANSIFAWIPRLRGTTVALNVDGIERQRTKWGMTGRLWYAMGERLALVFPNVIVADAQVIQDYYRSRYGRTTALIAYGATPLPRQPPPDLRAYGLPDIEAGGYLLYVSRLEPENQAHLVIEAYRRVQGTLPLLIVGDAPYADEYKATLRRAAAADPRVRLVGSVYGQGYVDLQRGALAYIQASSVGGTHPALIEAMAAGNLVLAFGSAENVEVTAGTALLFDDATTLAQRLDEVVADPHAERFESLRQAAFDRAEERYSWDAVAREYDRLFRAYAHRNGR